MSLIALMVRRLTNYPKIQIVDSL